MDRERALGPLVREMTRRKRAPRHSRLRLSTSIVDSCPASPDTSQLYTVPRREAASRSVRSSRHCQHATVCHAGGPQFPHCECLKVKTRPQPHPEGRNAKTGGSVTILQYRFRGANSNTASRGNNARGCGRSYGIELCRPRHADASVCAQASGPARRYRARNDASRSSLGGRCPYRRSARVRRAPRALCRRLFRLSRT